MLQSPAPDRVQARAPDAPFRIIVPVDESAGSTSAVDLAIQVARERGSEIMLLEVASIPRWDRSLAVSRRAVGSSSTGIASDFALTLEQHVLEAGLPAKLRTLRR